MFKVSFAPNTMGRLEQLVLQILDREGRTEAGQFLRILEGCISALEKDPRKDGKHMNGIPKRYWVRDVSPGLTLIYQINENTSSVMVDGIIENQDMEEL